MLERTALIIKDTMKRKNVDFVTTSFPRQTRRKRKKDKTFSMMFVKKKSAKTKLNRTVKRSMRVDINVSDSSEKSNVCPVWTQSVLQERGKKQSKLETKKTTQIFYRRALMRMLIAQSAGFLDLELNLAYGYSVDMSFTWIASKLLSKISGYLHA